MTTNLTQKLSRVVTVPHPNCFVCSGSNPRGLNLEFISGHNESISSEFCCSRQFEGYPGILHGGVIASIVDGAMTNCLFFQNIEAVTAELNVRFRKPVQIDCPAIVHAAIVRSDSPLFVVQAKITQNKKLVVTATGKFLKKPMSTE